MPMESKSFCFMNSSGFRFPDVVHQRERLSQVFIQSQHPTDGACDRSDFQGVRQALIEDKSVSESAVEDYDRDPLRFLDSAIDIKRERWMFLRVKNSYSCLFSVVNITPG